MYIMYDQIHPFYDSFLPHHPHFQWSLVGFVILFSHILKYPLIIFILHHPLLSKIGPLCNRVRNIRCYCNHKSDMCPKFEGQGKIYFCRRMCLQPETGKPAHLGGRATSVFIPNTGLTDPCCNEGSLHSQSS
jgi:hypothetical protein